MSLSVAALRIATVKALDGATSVGARVYDSVIDPVDFLGDAALPSIIVYTDAGIIDLKDSSIIEAPQIVDLTIEMFIGKTVTAENGDVSLVIPANDAGYENYLRCLTYEVIRALHRRDGTSPWPDLWSAIKVRGAQQQNSQWDRGANADNGRRFAFLRLVYRLEVVNDPVPGAPLTDLWTNLFAAMTADPELVDISTYWQSLISSPSVPDWRQAQIELGLTDAGIENSGLAPPFDTTTTDAAVPNVEISAKFPDEPSVIVVDPSQATITEGSGDPTKIEEQTGD
jgi:hypothetical protein